MFFRQNRPAEVILFHFRLNWMLVLLKLNILLTERYELYMHRTKNIEKIGIKI